MKANNHIIHKEGAFIDCVNCTECSLNGLAGLVTGLLDSDGHCHAVGSSECLKPEPETIIVSHCFDYGKNKFQTLSSTPHFYVTDLKRTLAYVTLGECKEQEPLLVRLPIPNEIKGPNFAIHVSKFPCGLNIQVGEALEITTQDKKGNQTRKLGQIIGYDKGVAHCRELLHANQVQDVGEDYGMNFKPFPDMLFMTDKVFDLKKFEPRPGYQCRNVTIGVAATIDSYSHLHTVALILAFPA